MNLFFQIFPIEAHILMRNILLIFCLFDLAIPIMTAEGCVKNPGLEPTPGVAPQESPNP